MTNFCQKLLLQKHIWSHLWIQTQTFVQSLQYPFMANMIQTPSRGWSKRDLEVIGQENQEWWLIWKLSISPSWWQPHVLHFPPSTFQFEPCVESSWRLQSQWLPNKPGSASTPYYRIIVPVRKRHILVRLYYILVRGGCTKAGEAAGSICGPWLGPGWTQDHTWMDSFRKFWFYPDLEPENGKRHNGS